LAIPGMRCCGRWFLTLLPGSATS